MVPVLNEGPTIKKFLDALRAACDTRCELIVVDGGSDDDTAVLARDGSDRLIVSPRGRASQMNAGAREASGDILCFVHADSILPRHAATLIRESLSHPERRWGRFDVRLSGEHPLLRVVEALMNVRSCLTGICTGDQGFFIERQLFDSVGGFPEIALMEDIALSKLLRKRSRPKCVRQRLITSSRRWENHGILRTILLMWKLRLLYFFGADPAHLAKKYYGRDD